MGPNPMGLGLELSMRVPCAADDETPPPWMLNLLSSLARYVARTGNTLLAGDNMDAIEPLPGQPTEIRALAFGEDIELPSVAAPHGRVQLIQVIGVTEDEVIAAQRWDMTQLLKVIRSAHPLLPMDPSRRSILSEPSTLAEVQRRTREEGSSVGAILAERVGWSTRSGGLRIKIDEVCGAKLVSALRGRVPYGRQLLIHRAARRRVGFVPGPRVEWKVDDETVFVTLTGDLLAEMEARSLDELGEHRFESAPTLVLEIVPWARSSADAGPPDFSHVVSRAVAIALYEDGLLERMSLLPPAFGGQDVPENLVFVPSGLSAVKDRIDFGSVEPMIAAGRATRYSAIPSYQSGSVVPIAIRIDAYDPGELSSTIEIWGDAIATRH